MALNSFQERKKNWKKVSHTAATHSKAILYLVFSHMPLCKWTDQSRQTVIIRKIMPVIMTASHFLQEEETITSYFCSSVVLSVCVSRTTWTAAYTTSQKECWLCCLSFPTLQMTMIEETIWLSGAKKERESECVGEPRGKEKLQMVNLKTMHWRAWLSQLMIIVSHIHTWNSILS